MTDCPESADGAEAVVTTLLSEISEAGRARPLPFTVDDITAARRPRVSHRRAPTKVTSGRLAVVWLGVVIAVVVALVIGFQAPRPLRPIGKSNGNTPSLVPYSHQTYLAAVNDFKSFGLLRAITGFTASGQPIPNWLLPSNFDPHAVVFRASARGPQGVVFSEWSYFPNGQRPPWLVEGVVTFANGIAGHLDGLSGQTGRAFDVSNTLDESEWNACPYWINGGELPSVPSGATTAAFTIAHHGNVDVALTNGWFLVVTPYQFPGSTPVTYFDRAGSVLGKGVYVLSGVATGRCTPAGDPEPKHPLNLAPIFQEIHNLISRSSK